MKNRLSIDGFIKRFRTKHTLVAPSATYAYAHEKKYMFTHISRLQHNLKQ